LKVEKSIDVVSHRSWRLARETASPQQHANVRPSLSPPPKWYDAHSVTNTLTAAERETPSVMLINIADDIGARQSPFCRLALDHHEPLHRLKARRMIRHDARRSTNVCGKQTGSSFNYGSIKWL